MRTPGRFALLLVVLTPACVDAPPPPAPLVVDAARSGASLTLRTGEELVVRLDANRTTGYAWTWTEGPAGVVAHVGAPLYETAPDGAAGAGGTEVFTFRAAAPGTTTLRFAYARSWERDAEPARVATYSVTVR